MDQQPARRNQFPRHRIDEIILIPRRIKIPQQLHPHARPATRFLDRFDRLLLLRLDPNHPFLRPRRRHAKLHPAHHTRRIMLHHRRILVEQRLTLRPIRDDDLRLRPQLHMRRKPPTPHADDASKSDLVDE